MSDKNSIIMERIRSLIDDSGLTRQEIAENMSCDTSLITKHYNGDRNVSIDFLIKYAEFFNTTTDYLLGLTNTKEKDNPQLRAVCDYTGLSEEAVERLKTNNSEEIKDRIRSINEFIVSDEFNKIIDYINRAKYNEDFVKYIFSIYFDKEFSTNFNLVYFNHNPLETALLSNFSANKKINEYFQKMSPLSNIVYDKAEMPFALMYKRYNFALSEVPENDEYTTEENYYSALFSALCQLSEDDLPLPQSYIDTLKEIYEEVKHNGK